VEDRDYVEWHGGIKEYGFWCFKITNQSWLEQIEGLQKALAKDLLDEYLRFPHITVATVGLMNASRWALLEKQVAKLTANHPKAVSVFWKEASSYKQVPMVRVASDSSQLDEIRKLLHAVTRGDDQEVYDPHITLGYYASQVELDSIYAGVEEHLLFNETEHLFTALHFCTYDSSSIKGSISIRKTFSLNGFGE